MMLFVFMLFGLLLCCHFIQMGVINLRLSGRPITLWVTRSCSISQKSFIPGFEFTGVRNRDGLYVYVVWKVEHLSSAMLINLVPTALEMWCKSIQKCSDYEPTWSGAPKRVVNIKALLLKA